MEDILLSIIIPVFNVEKYLCDCIESILNNQKNKRYEIILVDDGSTDNSSKICDEYKAENIIVIHKINGGLSSARNAGLKIARGKYIVFIDSDDYVAYNAINNLIESLDERCDIDLVFLQGDKVYPDGRESSLGDNISYVNINGKPKEEVLSYLSSLNKYAGSACTKVFRRDLLDEYDIHFPDDKRYGEDLIFVLKCIYHATVYCAMDFPYYKYRQQREGSITFQFNRKSYWDLFTFFEDAVALLTKKHVPVDENARKCMSFLAYEYGIQIWQYSQLTHDEKTKANDLLNQYRWIMKYANSRRSKAIAAILAVCGYNLTSKILAWAKKAL